jgi:hypothetical protein
MHEHAFSPYMAKQDPPTAKMLRRLVGVAGLAAAVALMRSPCLGIWMARLIHLHHNKGEAIERRLPPALPKPAPWRKFLKSAKD